MADGKAVSDILRDSIYCWLSREFKKVEDVLSPEMKTELDGVVWKLSGTLTNAGLWESLRKNAGIDFEEGAGNVRTIR